MWNPRCAKKLHLRWPYECAVFSKPVTKSGWPSIILKHKIMTAGCHIVPKTPRKFGEKGPKSWFKTYTRAGWFSMPVWRISFSLSEKLLIEDFSIPQKKCLLLLKVFFQVAGVQINERLEKEHGEDNFVPFNISSFMLKHIMFWTMEEVNQSEWRLNNLYNCMLHVIGILERFLRKKCVPHYFFGERKNLLHGDIIEGTENENKLMETKCNTMLKGLEQFKNKDLFEHMIVSSIYPEICLLDFQWDCGTDLYQKVLIESYMALAMSILTKSADIKEKMMAHHKVMVNLIQFADRKYGDGVDSKHLNIFQNELKIMSKDVFSFQNLIVAEKRALKRKIKKKIKNMENRHQFTKEELGRYIFCNTFSVPVTKNGKDII